MVMKAPVAGFRDGDEGAVPPNPDGIFSRANAELAAHLETLGIDRSRVARAALRPGDEAIDTRVAKSISVIIPVYNEERNIPLLVERLFAVLDGLARPFEVIAVNDGSTDRSIDALRAAAAARAEFKVVNLARNYGQTAAMMAALDFASGEIIVPIDADLQNDPADIPALLAKLDEGYDVVSGWRKDRKDGAIKKNLVSRIANSLISWISGLRLHDYGCSLKAYRRSVIAGVRLYGEMHRFVPIYASWYGARIAEVPVRHHPRVHGSSHYGLERILKVLLDLLVVKFLDRYLGKPIYVFGGFGLLWLAVSFVTLIYVFYLKLFDNLSMILTPLPMLVATSFMMGIMSILIGILAEIVVRIYFEAQSKLIYHTRETVNLDPPRRT